MKVGRMGLEERRRQISAEEFAMEVIPNMIQSNDPCTYTVQSFTDSDISYEISAGEQDMISCNCRELPSSNNVAEQFESLFATYHAYSNNPDSFSNERLAPANKNIDALGILSTQNNMELIVIESSSGRLKEHTSHTIEDSLKILECGVASLKKQATSYKNASLHTFKKLKVYSVHIIKTQVTLSELPLFNESHWKFVEERSAKLLTNWNDRLEMIQYLELFQATLFDDVLNAQLIQKELTKENLGLVNANGPTVGSISKKSCFDSHAFNHIIRHH